MIYICTIKKKVVLLRAFWREIGSFVGGISV